ncbi:unnamed protein product [Clonostachys rosea f. rosea IK726]|jgi:hypothetical protein|uniref:Uncharacterized protein n=1 Tax=Clonostachys rosea f. rosea IK726 TaxID=1349383 RepID=A0ACA9UJU1_BIOOC|nr:unnamed protein product [Clonostachys rosea f. rosea IK726]
MRFSAILSLLSVAVALPSAVNYDAHDNGLSIAEREVGKVFNRAPEQSAQDIAILVERALLDQTADWPSSSVSLGNISFQIQVDNLGSNRFKITWWNSDAANSQRKIKLTFNAGDGARLYDVVTSPQTRGNTEVTKRGTQFRAIFDQE